MKKLTLFLLVAVAVLFTACGEDEKKRAAEAKVIAVKAAADAATKAAEEKAAADAAAKAAEEKAAAKAAEDKAAADAATKAAEEKAAAKAAEEKAAEAVEATKEVETETVAAVKEEVAPTADNIAGQAAYAKCSGCHGKDGKTKALGKSEVVAGQAVADLVTKLAEYKAGTRNVSGMGTLMKGQVASMSDDDIKAVSEYMSGM